MHNKIHFDSQKLKLIHNSRRHNIEYDDHVHLLNVKKFFKNLKSVKTRKIATFQIQSLF